jgi:hypothetical protein
VQAEVQVNIYTDVSEAMLLVNGDTQGPLSSSQTRTLKLRPGAYRFEAQAEGGPVAVTVVTVRGDTPMDVFLKARAPVDGDEGTEPDELDEQDGTERAQGAQEGEGDEPKREPAGSATEQEATASATRPPADERKPSPSRPAQEEKPVPERSTPPAAPTAATAQPPAAQAAKPTPPASAPQTAAPQAPRRPARDGQGTPESVSAADGIPDNPF